jgi:NADPH2:quinone reductase
VLVLGATGVVGQLAVQFAKHLGAGAVIAAGRDRQVLATLPGLGADVTVSLDQPDQDLPAALAATIADTPVDVVIDYLWGRPTEALIAAISRRGLTHAAHRLRLVEVGDSAGATITLPAQVLRSSGLELRGSGAGTVPLDAIMAALPQFIDRAAGDEFRIGVEQVPLA